MILLVTLAHDLLARNSITVSVQRHARVSWIDSMCCIVVFSLPIFLFILWHMGDAQPWPWWVPPPSNPDRYPILRRTATRYGCTSSPRTGNQPIPTAAGPPANIPWNDR